MATLPQAQTIANPFVREALDSMKTALREALPDATFAERERAALELTNTALREVLQEELQAIANEFDESVRVDGVEYTRHQPGTIGYHSLVGELRVARATCRQVGVRNGPTLVPLELAVGLVEHATPALGLSVALGYSRTDMRTHLETLEAAHRCPPARATLERIAKTIAGNIQHQAPRIESQLRRSEKLPAGTHAVSVGPDRTSVPMSELRPEGSAATKTTRKTPRIRQAPAPIDVNFRMAYVGTVSIVDKQGEALITRRYAIPACDDPKEIAKRMAADVRAALRKNSSLSVGIVQDGAHEMWNVMRAAMKSLVDDKTLTTWHEAIDRFHLLERLGTALKIAEPDATKRACRLADYRERLDRDDFTINSVERYLKRCYAKLPAKQQSELWEHLVYIRNNRERLRYVGLRALGLPVGSGVTESAAKTVIGARAKRSGQRWSQAGLRGALALRAIDQSERLPGFWRIFSRGYVASVKAA